MIRTILCWLDSDYRDYLECKRNRDTAFAIQQEYANSCCDSLPNVEMVESLPSKRLRMEIARANENCRQLRQPITPFTRAKQRRERP